MLQSVGQLNNEYVEVGHFQEQGQHYSGYTYPELMQFHHSGSNLGGDYPLPPRPLLDFLWANNLRLQDPKIKAAMKAWGQRTPSQQSNAKLLDDIGAILAEKEREMFGKSPPLAPNADMTVQLKGKDSPLVDTGDLRDHVSHRDSINKSIRRK